MCRLADRPQTPPAKGHGITRLRAPAACWRSGPRDRAAFGLKTFALIAPAKAVTHLASPARLVLLRVPTQNIQIRDVWGQFHQVQADVQNN